MKTVNLLIAMFVFVVIFISAVCFVGCRHEPTGLEKRKQQIELKEKQVAEENNRFSITSENPEQFDFEYYFSFYMIKDKETGKEWMVIGNRDTVLVEEIEK